MLSRMIWLMSLIASVLSTSQTPVTASMNLEDSEACHITAERDGYFSTLIRFRITIRDSVC